jgi:ABC-type transport system substrate-binding protein
MASFLFFGVVVAAVGMVAGEEPPSKTSKKGGKAADKRAPVDEQEDTDTQPKRKPLPLDPEDENPTPPPKATPVTDLGKAAKEAHNREIRMLFLSLAVPYDWIMVREKIDPKPGEDRFQERRYRVDPVAFYTENPRDAGAIQAEEIDATGKRLRTIKVPKRDLVGVQYYERLAMKEVGDFLKSKEILGPDDSGLLRPYDRLVAAEQALAAIVRFHDSARSREIRKGDGWSKVENELRGLLLKVLLGQLKILTDGSAWDPAFTLSQRLAQTYTREEDLKAFAGPLANLLEKGLRDKSVSADRRKEALRRLRLLEARFPNSAALEPIRKTLEKYATSLYEKAKKLNEDKKTAEALALLNQAEESWPQMPGLRTYRMGLDKTYQVLRVGGRELPRYLSPGRALGDADRRAVEMLFESLVKLGPDAKGALFYSPGMAEGRPKVVALGREFRLPRDASWSDGASLSHGDVSYTVDRLRKGAAIGRSAVWGDPIDKFRISGDPFRFKILLHQGHLDPLSFMAFKVLPRRSKPDPTSVEFALNPITSGPYLYKGKHGKEEGAEYVKFTANPYYGSRPGKRELPRIREVRFYARSADADPVKDLEAGRVDLALDLTADQAEALSGKAAFKVTFPSLSLPNRRIYFLAINHRKTALADANVRIALARAINREQLLDNHFRGKLARKVHKAINGPFPAGAWASNPELVSRSDKASLDAYDLDLGRSKLKKSGQKDLKLTLKYPSGDKQLAAAMTALCEDLSKKEALGISIKAEAVSPEDLRKDVESTNNYDLAYYYYDFPDETFWLMPLLGTSTLAGGENYLGYTGPLVGKIQSAMGQRNFAQVKRYTHAIHREFLEKEMPFIPLWQLNPLHAYRIDEIQTVPFDPHLLFTDLEHWRVTKQQ